VEESVMCVDSVVASLLSGSLASRGHETGVVEDSYNHEARLREASQSLVVFLFRCFPSSSIRDNLSCLSQYLLCFGTQCRMRNFKERFLARPSQIWRYSPGDLGFNPDIILQLF